MKDTADRTQRLAKNTSVLFVRMVVLLCIGLFTSRETLRILGVEDYGIYNLVATFVVMFGFLQAALNNATSRFIIYDLGRGNQSALRRIFSMSINIEILLALVVVLLSEAVGPWFIETRLNIPQARCPAAQTVFQISLVNFVIELVGTPYGSLVIAHERMAFFAYVSVFQGVMKLAVIYCLTAVGFDRLIVLASLYTLVSLACFTLTFIYCRTHFEESAYKRLWDRDMFKRLTSYSGLSLLVNMSDTAVRQSISVFLNIFGNVVANAALGVANQVAGVLNQFLGNFSQSYWPQIVKSYAAGDRAYFMALLFSASKLSFLVLFGVSFPVALNIGLLLRLWLVDPPPQAGSFLVAVSAYALFDSFSQPLWQAVHATGNLKVHQWLMGSIKALTIPVSYMLLRGGLPVITPLVVYAVSNAVCSVVRIWWLSHLIALDVRAYLASVVWPMLAVVVAATPLPLFLGYAIADGWWHFGLTVVTFALAYPTAVWFIALNTREKMLVVRLMNKLPVIQRFSKTIVLI